MKVLIGCRQFARSDWIGIKDRKRSREKTEKLQKGDWHDNRFDRE